MKNVHVDLERRSYEIHIASGLISSVGRLLKSIFSGSITAVITNETIAPLYLPLLETSLRSAGFDISPIILHDGEQFKTLDSMRSIYEQLLECGLDRSALLIALGGGVVGDMAGFAAATYMRGIPFVQIPTTLLAQVDSSVGGKTGVNLPGGKNTVGAFYQPRAVFIDPLVLETLPERQLRAGLAEVIKYGIIRDPALFAFIEERLDSLLHRDADTTASVIKQCCMIKSDIVSRDETEQGVRAHLNFGHTLGHAVESLTGYSAYLHGEAVAIGMWAAARLSRTLGLCATADVQRIESLLASAGLPTVVPSFSVSAYMGAMLKDKKKTGSTVNFVLTHRIGEVALHPVGQERLRAFLARDLSMS